MYGGGQSHLAHCFREHSQSWWQGWKSHDGGVPWKRGCMSSSHGQTRKLTRANSGYDTAFKTSIHQIGHSSAKFYSLFRHTTSWGWSVQPQEPVRPILDSNHSTHQPNPCLPAVKLVLHHTRLFPPCLAKPYVPKTPVVLSPLWSVGAFVPSRLSWYSCLLPGYNPSAWPSDRSSQTFSTKLWAPGKELDHCIVILALKVQAHNNSTSITSE